MMRRFLRAAVLSSLSILPLLCFLAIGCTPSTTSSRAVLPLDSRPALPDLNGPDFFKEVTADSGINFTYRNGEEAMHLAILESLGGGVGLIDYDGDGLLDIFLPGGGYFAGPDKKEIRGYPCKLYKNLGNYRFRDVTKEVGLDQFPWFYSHAVAIGDYDRDGWPDILLTGWGRVALFHNEPIDPKDPAKGRKFVDVTEKAHLTGFTWATSAGWADLDGDGYPDLYVCQYANWSFKNHPTDCKYDGSTRDVCPPKHFDGLQHKLFKNNGNGTFNDITQAVSLTPGGPDSSKGLGVLLVPMRGQGRADIYAANDTVPKLLYENLCTPGTFRFKELGQASGATLDEGGGANGSMGLACGDYDGRGLPGLFVTNYEGELNALYKNQSTAKRISFSYDSLPTGLAAVSQIYVGWGTAFLDLDHHGWEDLIYANGHAIRYPTGAGVTRAQTPKLMRNLKNPEDKTGTTPRIFREVSNRGGAYFQKPHLSRGLAIGDLTNSGRIDVVINNLNEPTAVLRNIADLGKNHWLGVQLAGKDHADVVGARGRLGVGERTLSRWVIGGGSYASSSDRRLMFGLGEADKVGRLSILWPDGTEQHWDTGLAVDGYYRITQGEATPQRLTPP